MPELKDADRDSWQDAAVDVRTLPRFNFLDIFPPNKRFWPLTVGHICIRRQSTRSEARGRRDGSSDCPRQRAGKAEGVPR
jgi:hypothetical protein